MGTIIWKFQHKEIIPYKYKVNTFDTVRESIVQMLDTLGCQNFKANLVEELWGKEST